MKNRSGAAGSPNATHLCLEAAARLGIEAQILDPEYGYLFELRRGDQRRVLLGGRSPLNDAVAARLAEDKYYAGLLLARAGLRVPETVRCLSPQHESLREYRARAGMAPGEALAERQGFPLVVKPNRLSHGRGVQLVENRLALAAAIRSVWQLDAIALVQTPAAGRDFRLDFLDGSYLAGYERRPLEVRGDGRRRLADLFAAADARYADPARLRQLTEEPRIAHALESRGWTLRSVIPDGALVAFPGPIRNLHGPSTGRWVSHVPERLRQHCVRAGEALGLRHFGVDLKLPFLEADPAEATVIEINASPLLTQIYLLGHREVAVRAQMQIINAMFA